MGSFCGSSVNIEATPIDPSIAEANRATTEAMQAYLAYAQSEADAAAGIRGSMYENSDEFTPKYTTRTNPASFKRAEGGWREVTKEEADAARLAGYGRYIRDPAAATTINGSFQTSDGTIATRDSEGIFRDSFGRSISSDLLHYVAGATTIAGDDKYYMEGTYTAPSSTQVVSGYTLTDVGKAKKKRLEELANESVSAQTAYVQANKKNIELQSQNTQIAMDLFPTLVKEQLGLDMVKDSETGKYTFTEISGSVQAKQKEITLLALERTRKALIGELDVPKDLELHWNQEQVNFEESMRKQWGSGWQEAATEQLAKFQSAKAASLDAARRGELATASSIAMQVKPIYSIGGLPNANSTNPFSIASPSVASDYSANLANQWRGASPSYDYFVNAAQGYQLPAQNLTAYQNYTGNIAIANAQNQIAAQQGFGQLLGTAIGSGAGVYAAGR